MSNITDFKTLSFSKASSFNDCEKKFSFSYIEKVRTKSGIHAAVGTFVHEVIEDFFNQKNFLELLVLHDDKELGYLTEIYERNWKKHSSMLTKLYEEEPRTPEEFTSLEEWVKTLIKNYIELEHYLQVNKDNYPDLFLDSSISILNEKRFTKNFEYEESNDKLESFELQGYIDRLVLKNEPNENNQFSCSIVDIKTAKPSGYGNNDKKDQIKTYQFLVTKGLDKKSQETKSFVVTNGYLFFLGGKDIEVEKRILKVDENQFHQIDDFIKHKFEKTLENILTKRRFDIEMNTPGSTSSPWKTKPQILCGWCDYKSVCDEWVNKIVDKDVMSPANETFKRVRHIGGINKLKTLQKNKFYRLFYNSQNLITQIVSYYEDEFKPDIILFGELLKNVSSSTVVEQGHQIVFNELKKYIKLARSEDENVASEIKNLMLLFLKDEDKFVNENVWTVITDGINLLNNNREKIQNVNFDEFNEFVLSSREVWKKSQLEANYNKDPFEELILLIKKFEEYKFFNFKFKSGIRNFKKELNRLIVEIENFSNYLKLQEDRHNINLRNKEITAKCLKLDKLLNKYANNLKNFENVKT